MDINAQNTAGRRGIFQVFPHIFFKTVPVFQAGKDIVVQDVFQLFFISFLLGNIHKRTGDHERISIFIMHSLALAAYPDHGVKFSFYPVLGFVIFAFST